MKMSVYIPFSLYALALLAGCHAEGPSTGITNPEVCLPYNTVIVLDKKVTDWTHRLPWERQSKISIDRNKMGKTATGLLQVEITIRNRTDHIQRLDIQTKYFSVNESQVDESAIETMVLRPQDSKEYTNSSMTDTAMQYRVEISGAQ